MEFPQNVREKLSRLLRKRKTERDARRQTKLEERKKRRELKALRESRKEELLNYARALARWLREFAVSEEGRKMFAVCGRPHVFCASFWMGLPSPDSAMTTLATLEILKDTKVFYCERYKGNLSRETFLGFAIDDGKMVHALFSKLHPEYLEQAAKAIESGEAWRYIENSLPR